MKRVMDRIEEIWCSHMHKGVMWPIRGRYICRECHREYPVPFASEHPAGTHPGINRYQPAADSLY